MLVKEAIVKMEGVIGWSQPGHVQRSDWLRSRATLKSLGHHRCHQHARPSPTPLYKPRLVFTVGSCEFNLLYTH